MAVPLTNEMKAALDANPGGPVAVVDDRTNEEYVLVSAAKYELIQAYAEMDDEKDRADWQALGMQTLWRAGWNDPIMDEYDNYDENLRKLRGEAG